MTTSPHRSQSMRVAKWMLLPLRLFLGITFIYAGLQKLTDPQFFQPSATGYIGKQIVGFANGSPLHDFLLNVALPHATLFGGLVAYGEIAIGVGTILGLLLRPAAFFGTLISLLFFLSATWRVHPYFYGSDIVFAFAWLTLLIAGPTNTGLPALDELFVRRYLSPKQQKQFAPQLSFFIGVSEDIATPDDTQAQTRSIPSTKRLTQQQSRFILEQQQRKASRRTFLFGALSGGAGILALAWLWNTLHFFPASSDTVSTPTASGATQTPSSTATASGTPAATAITPIAQANAIKNNSSVSFTLASNGDPGILVRLNNGQLVAYDAVCTHAGCPVDYDPTSQMLVCPCHGAAFDPAKAAAVVQGPAATPLTSVPVHVDSSGAITAG